MTWSLGTIRTALASALSTVVVPNTTDTLRAHGTIPAQVNPPAAVILVNDPAIEYDLVLGDAANGTGADTIHLVVLVLTGLASERIAQDVLDAYMNPTGTSSVKAAIEGTLGGAALDCSVTTVGAPKIENYAGTEQGYLGIRFVVEVMV